MERKSFKWMIVDLMFMYIVTGLGLILMAFLMEKFQLNGTFVEVGVTVWNPDSIRRHLTSYVRS